MTDERKHGLISQIFALVIVGIIIIGLITYFSQYYLSQSRIKARTASNAAVAAGEVISSFEEYPAYKWLLAYWAEHADQMEIEYDVDFSAGTSTEEKCALLTGRHPKLQLRYCSEDEVRALPEEDQKLYAEIVYSWILTRVNAIKQNFLCDYLYCVMTDTDSGELPYRTQTFLMSGGNPGSVRGTEYGEVYILGVSVSVEDKKGTQTAMRSAVESASEGMDGTEKYTSGENLRDAGNYVDYYACLEQMGDKAVLVGVTYHVQEMLSEIHTDVVEDSFIAMLYQFLLVQLIMYHILIFVLRPLKEILQNIRSYTKTKDSAAIESNLSRILSGKKALAIRRNEIGQLAEDFVNLTKEIDDYTVRIEDETAVRKRMEYELETAAQIQLHMLPQGSAIFQEHPEFELSARMTPAREVGGDFYDYFLIDKDHLVMAIADVSDKGVPAALFMAEAKALIKSGAESGEEPGEILFRVNNQLSENNEAGYFVTIWLAVIDLRTGEGMAANGGHEHPALARRGEDFELVIYKHDVALGLIEDIPYHQHSFRLNPGDRLFVYTDGVPEANGTEGEQFGTGRMLKALNRRPDMSPGELLNSISGEIDAFMGKAPRFDDTTMMCLRYDIKEEERNG